MEDITLYSLKDDRRIAGIKALRAVVEATGAKLSLKNGLAAVRELDHRPVTVTVSADLAPLARIALGELFALTIPEVRAPMALGLLVEYPTPDLGYSGDWQDDWREPEPYDYHEEEIPF